MSPEANSSMILHTLVWIGSSSREIATPNHIFKDYFNHYGGCLQRRAIVLSCMEHPLTGKNILRNDSVSMTWRKPTFRQSSLSCSSLRRLQFENSFEIPIY